MQARVRCALLAVLAETMQARRGAPSPRYLLGQSRRVIGALSSRCFLHQRKRRRNTLRVLVVIIRSSFFLCAAAPPPVDMSRAGVPAVVDDSPPAGRSDLRLSGARGKYHLFHWTLHARVSCIQINVFSGSLHRRANCVLCEVFAESQRAQGRGEMCSTTRCRPGSDHH